VTRPHAENAEHVFFVGGEDSDYQKVSPIMSHMGKKHIHLGPSGSASSYKLLVNNLLALNMAAFSETVQLGRKMGLSAAFHLSQLPALPVSAPFLQMKAPNIKEGNYTVQFPLEWMHKDIKLALSCSDEYNAKMPITEAAEDIYLKAKIHYSREDFSAVHKQW
ncbi:MAG: NAD(P)-dependent oxidoreductase, partial [Flavobacteriales bacterium]|nr:NAD(P)-dependent oxidoreductase [Flavobacteriales bacterium]